VVSDLCDIWDMWNLPKAGNFFEFMFNDMWDNEDTSGEGQFQELIKTEKLEDWEGEPFVPGFKAALMQIATMQVACAYAIDSFRSEKGSPEAWAYACEAVHWLGILQGIISGRGFEQKDGIPFDFSALGAKGAAKRHAPMKQLEAYAVSLYDPNEWKSANQAAHALQVKIMEYGRLINAPLTPSNAQRTIAEWFRKNLTSR
jgi:hypothetical protein